MSGLGGRADPAGDGAVDRPDEASGDASALTLGAWLRGCGLARLDAQALAGALVGRPRAWLIAHADDTVLAPHERRLLDAQAARVAGGEPLAYVLGEREFYGLSFAVGPGVLVPRPETELLVDCALARLRAPAAQPPLVVDLGCGSGCIALAIARHAPRPLRILGVDASPQALSFAKRNTQRILEVRADSCLKDEGLELHWRPGDWLDALAEDERADLIVANPPYIAPGDAHLAALAHEPRAALVGADADGLGDLRRIVAAAPRRLRAAGELWLEHGWDQAAAVRALLTAAGFERVRSLRDLAGIERVSGGLWPGSRSADSEDCAGG